MAIYKKSTQKTTKNYTRNKHEEQSYIYKKSRPRNVNNQNEWLSHNRHNIYFCKLVVSVSEIVTSYIKIYLLFIQPTIVQYSIYQCITCSYIWLKYNSICKYTSHVQWMNGLTKIALYTKNVTEFKFKKT